MFAKENVNFLQLVFSFNNWQYITENQKISAMAKSYIFVANSEIATKADQDTLNEISYKSSYEFLDSLLRFLKGPLTDIFSPKTLRYVIKEKDEGNEEIIFSEEETRNLFFKTFKGYDFYERINKIAWQYAMVFTEKRHYNKVQHRGLKERFKQILYSFDRFFSIH